MNETISTKYQLAPETIEKRSLNPNNGKYFQEIYDLWELEKLKIIKWETINMIKKLIEEKEHLNLDPLNLDEKVLVSAERLKKKDTPGNLYKVSTKNMPFLI